MIKSRSHVAVMGLYPSSLYRLRIVVLIFVRIFYSGCAGIQNPPEFVTGDMPNYPEAAKADRTSGWVDVEYLISPQGENYYRYDNGICTEVTVIRDFGTLHFNLSPESYLIVNSLDSSRNR